MSTPRDLWLRGLLAATAGLLSWVISHTLYQGVPTGADENSYVFQAHNFAEGRIARPYPPLADYLKQGMIILDEKAGWLSRYPPGHPLWLTPGVWLGSIYSMIALAAAAALWFTCAAAAQAGLSAVTAGLLLLLSPFFILMYGTQLSHTSGMAAVALMLYGYLGWLRTERWPWAALAGLAWSFFFLNRTYTAMLMAIPFGLHALWTGARHRRWPIVLGVVAFASCATLGVISYLVYNKLAVGGFFTATYLYYAPTEGLGFGPRRLQGYAVEHTLARGLGFLKDDVHQLNRWLFGWPGSLIAAIGLGLLGWKRWTAPVLAATVAVWIGYVFFWFPGVTDAGGPVYFFETIPFLILLTASGLQRIGRSLPVHRRLCAGLAAAGFLLLALSTVQFLRAETPPILIKQQVNRQTTDIFHQVPASSLLMVSHLRTPHASGMLFNPRGLDSDPLLMLSMGDYKPIAPRFFPSRKVFHYDVQRPGVFNPLTPPATIELDLGAGNMARRTGRTIKDPGSGLKHREARAEWNDPPEWMANGALFYLPRGRYEMIFKGLASDIDADRPSRCDIATRVGRTILTNALVVGSANDTLAQLEIYLPEACTQIEPRLYYGGSGNLRFDRLLIRERKPFEHHP